MADERELLAQIAASLERIAPSPHSPANWTKHPAYLWSAAQTHPIKELDALPLERLRGIDAQKRALCDNLERLSKGSAAHDMLLWGAPGMGKSALIRASVLALQQRGQAIALVQIAADGLARIPELLEALAAEPRSFVLFFDDLGFDEGELQANLTLRSLLDGGALARPRNVKIAVTSNRRAIVERSANSESTLHERDERDSALALADRFGLTLAFHPCDQETYLEIVRSYAQTLGLTFDEAEAKSWAIKRGNRSGRTAYQFACEIAGRAGLAL